MSLDNKVRIFATQDVRHLNLTPALDHGDEIVAITPSGDANFSLDDTRVRVYAAMDSFDPEVDKVLLVGDPVVILMVGAAFKEKYPDYHMSVLKWDRMTARYIELLVNP